jgi:hypothetical protein
VTHVAAGDRSADVPRPGAQVVDEGVGHLERGEVAALRVLGPVDDVGVELGSTQLRTGGTISFG